MTTHEPVAYSIRTDRLLMRCWSHEDAPRLRTSLDRSSEHLRPWIPFMKSEPRSLEDTARWLIGRRAWFDERTHFIYGMFTPDGSELIGEMTLQKHGFPHEFEIGYWVDIEHTGKGYGLEGSAVLTRLAFEHHAAALIEINFASENAASGSIPRKLGYTHEGTRANRYVDCNGDRHDLDAYVLFEKDYETSPSKGYDYEPLDALGNPL